MGSVKGDFRLLNVKDINAELALNMSVGDWIHIAKYLNNLSENFPYYDPISQLHRIIKELVAKASKEFNAYEPSELETKDEESTDD